MCTCHAAHGHLGEESVEHASGQPHDAVARVALLRRIGRRRRRLDRRRLGRRLLERPDGALESIRESMSAECLETNGLERACQPREKRENVRHFLFSAEILLESA